MNLYKSKLEPVIASVFESPERYSSYSPKESSKHKLFLVESSEIERSSGCFIVIILDKEPQLFVESDTVAVIFPGELKILKYPFSLFDSIISYDVSVFHEML